MTRPIGKSAAAPGQRAKVEPGEGDPKSRGCLERSGDSPERDRTDFAAGYFRGQNAAT